METRIAHRSRWHLTGSLCRLTYLQRHEMLLLPLDEVVLHLHQLPTRQLQPPE